MLPSAYDTKRNAFIAELGIWPKTTMSVNGVSTRCIATPRGKKKEIRRADLYPSIDSTFSLLKEDFQLPGDNTVYPGSVTLGIAELGLFESSGDTYQVFKIDDDADEPTIDLRSNIKV